MPLEESNLNPTTQNVDSPNTANSTEQNPTQLLKESNQKAYASLSSAAERLFATQNTDSETQGLISQFQQEYQAHSRKQSARCEQIAQQLEKKLYDVFTDSLFSQHDTLYQSGDEEKQHSKAIKRFEKKHRKNFQVIVDGKETATSVAKLSIDQLQDAHAFRVLPKDFEARHAHKGALTARLTISVHKKYAAQLANLIPKLFFYNRRPKWPVIDNTGWLMEARFLGPMHLRANRAEIVICFSETGIAHANEIKWRAIQQLPANAFIDHAPLGTQQLEKGFAYSESIADDFKGRNSDHPDQIRAKLVAKTVSTMLLRNRSVNEVLPSVLVGAGYSVRNPALITKTLKEASYNASNVHRDIGKKFLEQAIENSRKLDRSVPVEQLVENQRFYIDPATNKGLAYLHERDKSFAPVLENTNATIHTFLPAYATGDRYTLAIAALFEPRLHISVAYSEAFDGDTDVVKAQKLKEQGFAKEAVEVIKRSLRLNGVKDVDSRVALLSYRGNLKKARESLDDATTRSGFTSIEGRSPLTANAHASSEHIFHVSVTTELIARRFRNANEAMAKQQYQEIQQKLQALVTNETRAVIDGLVDALIQRKNIQPGDVGLWIADRDNPNAREAEAISRPAMFEQIADALKKSGKRVFYIADTYVSKTTNRYPYRPEEAPHIGKFWDQIINGEAIFKIRENQWYFMDRLLSKTQGGLVGIRSGALEPFALMGHNIVYLEHKDMFTRERHGSWQGVISYNRLTIENTAGYLNQNTEVEQSRLLDKLIAQVQEEKQDGTNYKKVSRLKDKSPNTSPPSSGDGATSQERSEARATPKETAYQIQQRLDVVNDHIRKGVMSEKELALLVSMLETKKPAFSLAEQIETGYLTEKIKQATTDRSKLQKSVQSAARKFKVNNPSLTDGISVTGQDFTTPALLNEWEKLRTSLRSALDSKVAPLKTQLEFLWGTHTRRGKNQVLPFLPEKIKILRTELATYDYYYQLIRDSSIADRELIDLLGQQKIALEKGKTSPSSEVALNNIKPDDAVSIDNRYLQQKINLDEINHDDYVKGHLDYRKLSIPGYLDSMSLQEMQKLFLDGNLALAHLGALAHHIETARENEAIHQHQYRAKQHAEYISNILNQAATVMEDFQGQGSHYHKPIPQDFYLSRVGDISEGRCYPLVHTMAVALDKGINNANDLVEKMFVASASPHTQESVLLKQLLATLHVNKEATEAFATPKRTSLTHIIDQLRNTDTSKFLALNTTSHVLLVGMTVKDGKKDWHFYDPNFGLAAYANPEALARVLNTHFIDRGFATYYEAFGSNTDPHFDVAEINTTKMASVRLGGGVTVTDLSYPQQLTDLVKGEIATGHKITTHIHTTDEHLHLNASLSHLKTKQLAQRFKTATQEILTQKGLRSHWAPLLSRIETSSNGNYRIPFINYEDPTSRTRWITTQKSIFHEVKGFIERYTKKITQKFDSHHKSIFPKRIGGVGLPDAQVIDGMGTAMALQQLVSWFLADKRDEVGKANLTPQLEWALKLHGYVSLAQITYSTVQDISHIARLIQTVRHQQRVVDTAVRGLSRFSLNGTAPYVGIGGGVLFAGFDLYELVHAQDEIQKAVFGTQLVFDIANIVVSGAGLYLGAATTAGAILSSGGVLLGGVAVGATALAQAYGIVAQDAAAVGNYFQALDDAYKAGGYRYDESNAILSPLEGAVIESINLKNSRITLDSQYIYRTRSGNTGSGKINYFFWAGDMPVMVKDRMQAIEIRSAIGYQEKSRALSHSETQTIILPATLKSYISYTYQSLPGATNRHDTGFNVLRRLEEDKRFDYDFYIFPLETIVNTITHEYLKTSIDITLDDKTRELHVPDLSREKHGYLTYNIKGGGGQTALHVRDGVSIKLTSTADTLPSHWIINTRNLPNREIKIFADHMTIGNYKIEVSIHSQDKFSLITHAEEVSEIDFSTQTRKISALTASQWAKDNKHSIDAHLSALSAAQQLSGKYVVIEDYSVTDVPYGRAHYDVKNSCMLFSKIKSLSRQDLKKLTDLLSTLSTQPIIGAVRNSDSYSYFRNSVSIFTNWEYTAQSKELTELNTLLENWIANEKEDFSSLNQLRLQINALIPKLPELVNKLTSLTNTHSNIRNAGETMNRHASVVLEKLPAGLAATLKQLPEWQTLAQEVDTLSTLFNQLNDELTPLVRKAKLSHEAQLVGTVKDLAYFYHAKEHTLWSVDIKSGEIKTQFISTEKFIQHENSRAWQDGETIYIEFDFLLEKKNKSSLCYRINKERIELISINDQAQLFTYLSETDQVDIDLEKLLVKYWNSPGGKINNTPLLFNAPHTTFIDSAIAAPMIKIAGKNKQDLTQYYWLRSDGAVIKPHLQTSPQSTITPSFDPSQKKETVVDLVLVATLTQSDGVEIFYFYNPSQQTLYRQEGIGPAVLDPQNPNALRVDINISSIVSVSEGLLVITKEGIIRNINAQGIGSIEAINEQWLTQHRHSWRDDLAKLTEGRTTPLAIVGIKTRAKNNTVAMWYYQNKLILANNPGEQALQFITLNTNEEWACLFDVKHGKLYKQPVLDAAIFDQAFINDLGLDVARIPPLTIELFPQLRFKSVSLVDEALHLTSTEGEILLALNLQRPMLIGVDQSWQMRNQDNLLSGLQQLAEKWQTGQEVLILEASADAPPTWYHIASQKIISTTHISHLDKPKFIGISQDFSSAYLYSQSQQTLYRIEDGSVGQIFSFDEAQRLENALMLEGSSRDDILAPPLLYKVQALALSGGKGRDRYQIDSTLLDHYQTIVIDNFDIEKMPDEINFIVPDLDTVFVARHKEDLLLTTTQSGVMIIQKVFGDDAKDYDHIKLITSDGVTTVESQVADLVNRMAIFTSPSSDSPVQVAHYQTLLASTLTIDGR